MEASVAIAKREGNARKSGKKEGEEVSRRRASVSSFYSIISQARKVVREKRGEFINRSNPGEGGGFSGAKF